MGVPSEPWREVLAEALRTPVAERLHLRGEVESREAPEEVTLASRSFRRLA